MQYKNPANRKLVLEGLKKAGRMDLVGFGPKCLIRPERDSKDSNQRTERTFSGHKASSGKRTGRTIRNTHKKKTRK